MVGIVLTRDFPIYTANWGALVNLESILQVSPSLRFPMFLEETEQKLLISNKLYVLVKVPAGKVREGHVAQRYVYVHTIQHKLHVNKV